MEAADKARWDARSPERAPPVPDAASQIGPSQIGPSQIGSAMQVTCGLVARSCWSRTEGSGPGDGEGSGAACSGVVEVDAHRVAVGDVAGEQCLG